MSMTKEEIKAKVAATIAGQGNQVDIAGTLAEILDAIVDGIPEAPEITVDISDYPISSRIYELPFEKGREILGAQKLILDDLSLLPISSPYSSTGLEGPIEDMVESIEGARDIKVFFENLFENYNEGKLFPNSTYVVLVLAETEEEKYYLFVSEY